MFDQNLDHGLAALAGHAARTSRLAAAVAVRERADRRRRRRRAAGGVLGVAVAGAVTWGLAAARPEQPAPVPLASPTVPGPTATAAPTPSPATTPSRTATSAGDAFSGTRQVRLLPVGSEATFAVGPDRRVALSGTFDDTSLFVIKRVAGDRYWIMTATLRSGGEALCLRVEDGSPATVVATGCDAGQSSQLFRFRRTGTVDGKPKYTIYTGADTYLVQDPTGELGSTGGVTATQIGEGTPDIDTPFLLPDQGPANLPTLD